MIATDDSPTRQIIQTPPTIFDPSSGSAEDTAALILMIKSKSERGFHLLYDKYCDALYGKLIKLVQRTDIAEDLLQETFVKIWRHIDGFNPTRGTLFTWMSNIAKNQAIDYLRSSGHRKQLLHVELGLFSLQMDYKSVTASNTSEVEFTDLKNETMHLDPKYAEVIDLIFFYGWTQEQTARILGLPLGTVKTRARKGLELLKMFYQ
ncbi:MAG: RNA polymerase sigma factor [Saprospiraceae bacterium]